jgi:hypothetical protein
MWTLKWAACESLDMLKMVGASPGHNDANALMVRQMDL